MTEIRVQVVSADTGEVAFGPGRLPNFADRAAELGDALNEVAAALRTRLPELDQGRDGWGLDEVALTFSLDLEAAAGVIIARASTRAGFLGVLTWRRSASPPGQ